MSPGAMCFPPLVLDVVGVTSEAVENPSEAFPSAVSIFFYSDAGGR